MSDRREATHRRSIDLADRTVHRLEELRRLTGKESIGDVVEDAIDLYARLRSSKEIAAFERLTPRLRGVLQMIAEGNSTKEIAGKLKITLKTVEFHRARLMKQLDIREIAGLVRFAVRVGAVLP